MFSRATKSPARHYRTPPWRRGRNRETIAVPYEFRRPTLARLRDRVWNPASKHLLAPQVFGVGWTLNMGRVFVGLKEMLTRDR